MKTMYIKQKFIIYMSNKEIKIKAITIHPEHEINSLKHE